MPSRARSRIRRRSPGARLAFAGGDERPCSFRKAAPHIARGSVSRRTSTVNRADLLNCDREPIHLSGAIQPHGMLLAIEAADLRVVGVSANSAAFIGIEPPRVLHRRLAEILPLAGYERLEEALLAADPGRNNPIRTVLRPELPSFDAIVHRVAETAILEFEPSSAGADDEAFRALRSFVERAQEKRTFTGLCAGVVDDVRCLTGFDRVMMYQFDEDWHGRVIAESAAAGMAKYLDFHFPASDIPRQARDLYTRNLIRLIPDATYVPVPLVCGQSLSSGAALDLSQATLRSVSPLHVQYLRNMGVRSSMSVSLVCEGRLWGLIACHHRQPLYLPFAVRTACELLARVAATQIVTLQSRAGYEERMRTATVQSRLIETMSQRGDLGAALVEGTPSIGELLEAGGAAVRLGAAEMRLVGTTPTAAQVMEIIAWLQQRGDTDIYSTASLPVSHEPFARFAAVASGLLALPISRRAGSYILWFRPELAQTITWGGDPNKPLDGEADATTLTPRKSFAAWLQVRERHAKPWTRFDEQAAIDFGRAIGGFFMRQNDQLVEANRALARTNAELDTFAHMTSHDLKEPLRGIRSYASHIVEDFGATLDAEAVAKLNGIIRLTTRMDELLASLLHFAGAGRELLEHRDVDLGNVVLEASEMLAGWLDERGVSVVIDSPLAHVLGDAANLREVFVNLLSNAAKYNDKPERWISVSMVDEGPAGSNDVVVAVRDNGVGIEPDQHDAIFRMFTRMHPRDAFGGGTGAGLAIVRKLLEPMGGSIRVESTVGAGSTFFVALPKSGSDTSLLPAG
jgi:light-regulated signal transduction histidine kinase (bacteriophytochrome)